MLWISGIWAQMLKHQVTISVLFHSLQADEIAAVWSCSGACHVKAGAVLINRPWRPWLFLLSAQSAGVGCSHLWGSRSWLSWEGIPEPSAHNSCWLGPCSGPRVVGLRGAHILCVSITESSLLPQEEAEARVGKSGGWEVGLWRPFPPGPQSPQCRGLH